MKAVPSHVGEKELGSMGYSESVMSYSWNQMYGLCLILFGL
jgi:hypothetical protein